MSLSRAALAALLFAGCPEEEETPTSPTPTEPTGTGGTSEGACDDPAANPWAGTCVETFLAGCFDPSGACTVGHQGLAVEITWANGATVEQRGLSTTLVASDGTECATGQTRLNTGGCASETTYTRHDGATQAYCIQLDGSMTVTCDDGTTLDLTAEDAEAGQSCQYGGDEACTVE